RCGYLVGRQPATVFDILDADAVGTGARNEPSTVRRYRDCREVGVLHGLAAAVRESHVADDDLPAPVLTTDESAVRRDSPEDRAPPRIGRRPQQRDVGPSEVSRSEGTDGLPQHRVGIEGVERAARLRYDELSVGRMEDRVEEGP